jgi:hypothetical protein
MRVYARRSWAVVSSAWPARSFARSRFFLAVQNLELAALRLDGRVRRRKSGGGRVVRSRRLLQPLAGAGDAAAKKLVLSFQFLPRFQLAGEGGPALRLGLGDNGALMGLLIFQQDGLGRGDTRLGLRYDRIVVRGLDLHQQLARLDALKTLHGNVPDIAAYPSAQPGRLGVDRGIVGGLDGSRSNPGVPTG